MRLNGNKYGARAVTIDGIRFASTLEGRRYQELKLLERGGAIFNLELQPKFELQPAFIDSMGKKHRAIYYIADFIYNEPGCGLPIVEDAKGKPTKEFLIKLKLFLYTHPDYEFRIVTK